MISLMEYSSRIIDASSNRLDDEISQNGVNEVEWSDVRVDPRPSPHNLIPFSLPCNAIFDNLLESKSAVNAERSVVCWELVLHSHCCIPILYSSGISVSSPLFPFLFFLFFLFFSLFLFLFLSFYTSEPIIYPLYLSIFFIPLSIPLVCLLPATISQRLFSLTTTLSACRRWVLISLKERCGECPAYSGATCKYIEETCY